MQLPTDRSIAAWESFVDTCEPAHINWIRTAKKLKSKTSVVNFDNSELSHTKLLVAVLAFAPKLARATHGEQNIGLVVPPSSGAIISTLALLLRGKTVVNLNYTASEESVRYAIEAANLKTVIVSSTFLERLKGRGMDMTSLLEGKNVIVLEQFRKKISKVSLLRSLIIGKLLPTWALKLRYAKRVDMNDTAAIVFSSGSEGTPKGVELSHRNLIANIKQMVAVLDPVENETMLASLPLFHSFGIAVTTLLPLSEGFKIVCQPDPTDALAVGTMVERHKVTLLLGTSTFLGLYARNPKFQPGMLASVRWVISGAEKLSETVRQSFRQKFGKEIYEGFGTTETSPVASVNIPYPTPSGGPQHQHGSVGQALPGTVFKIVDPETMEELPMGEAGLILIGGPQVMKGYLNDPDRTANAIYEKDGIRWYKTGDKGKLDEYGFLTIVDRYSRFAKIGGEMLSLTAIEMTIRSALPFEEIDIVAVGLPDESKGEKIALLFCGVEHEHTVIREHLVAAGVNPLMLPKSIHKVEVVPKLGSGKTDFNAAKRLALQLLSAA